MRRILLIVLVFAGAHLWTLRLPPLGHDSWRQCDVLGVGRNYCEEHASFWSPRVDSRGDKSGVTGMEFPILNWIEGRLACAGFDQVIAGRTISLLFSLLAIVCVGLLGATLPEEGAGWLAAAVFATAPLVWYFGVSVQPDMPAVALMLASLVALDRALRDGLATVPFVLSALLASLGILVKLPVIVFGLPAVVMLVSRRGWRAAFVDVRSWVYLALSVIPAVAWYHHARVLQEQGGLQTFYLGKSPGELLSDWARPSLYTSVFMQKLFDAYAFPAFSVAAIAALLLLRRAFPPWVKALMWSTLAYVMLAGRQIEHHFYYGLPLVPAIALGAVPSLVWCRDRLAVRWRLAVVAVVLGGAAAYAVQRVGHWWPSSGEAEAYRRAEAAVDQRVPPDDKIIAFSGGNPTMLWMLHRKGWLAPVEAVAWWKTAAPKPPVLVIDRHMANVEPIRAALIAEFKAAGYTPLVADPALDVWIHAGRSEASAAVPER